MNVSISDCKEKVGEDSNDGSGNDESAQKGDKKNERDFFAYLGFEMTNKSHRDDYNEWR